MVHFWFFFLNFYFIILIFFHFGSLWFQRARASEHKIFFHVLLDDEEVLVSNVKLWLLLKWSTSLNFIRKALPFRRFFQDFENFTVAVVNNVLSQLHRITKYRNCPDHLNLRELLFPNTMKRNSVLISFF